MAYHPDAYQEYISRKHAAEREPQARLKRPPWNAEKLYLDEADLTVAQGVFRVLFAIFFCWAVLPLMYLFAPTRVNYLAKDDPFGDEGRGTSDCMYLGYKPVWVTTQPQHRNV